MARFLPPAVVAVSYLLVLVAAFLVDVRVGVAVIGLIGLREAESAARP